MVSLDSTRCLAMVVAGSLLVLFWMRCIMMPLVPPASANASSLSSHGANVAATVLPETQKNEHTNAKCGNNHSQTLDMDIRCASGADASLLTELLWGRDAPQFCLNGDVTITAGCPPEIGLVLDKVLRPPLARSAVPSVHVMCQAGATCNGCQVSMVMAGA